MVFVETTNCTLIKGPRFIFYTVFCGVTLGEQPPPYSWDDTHTLHLRYKYEAFMPKGLLTRFIVAIHPLIVEQLVWKTGVVLEKDDTRVEIMEFYPRREIRIRVGGKNKRDLLTIVTYELDKLHYPFHRLNYDKLIPCNCAVCKTDFEPHFFRLDTVKARLEHSKKDIDCERPPFEPVDIKSLLSDVGVAIQIFDLPVLLEKINKSFNENEFRTLCLKLDVQYENLDGEGLEGKQREFLAWLERHGRLPELISFLRELRPNNIW